MIALIVWGLRGWWLVEGARGGSVDGVRVSSQRMAPRVMEVMWQGIWLRTLIRSEGGDGVGEEFGARVDEEGDAGFGEEGRAIMTSVSLNRRRMGAPFFSQGLSSGVSSMIE